MSSIFSAPLEAFDYLLTALLGKFFFCGYSDLPQEERESRMSVLMEKGAVKLDTVAEAYFLEAKEESNNIIVLAHTSSFQQLRPKNYDHYQNSAAVVLWNPTKRTPVQYKQDLQSVIEKVRELHPEKTITIIGRCSTVDPAIAVAADLEDKNINLVLDRGHGNAFKLARSQTFLSLLPCVQKVLKAHFDCQGEQKIDKVLGKTLFVTLPHGDDQLMSWKDQNLTEDLIKARGSNNNGDEIIYLSNSDHWTRWSPSTHEIVHRFMGIQASTAAFSKTPPSPSFFKRHIVPYLIQSWC